MLQKSLRKWLDKSLGQRVKFDEPMAKHTSFRVGGPADAFTMPQNLEELVGLIKWSQENNLTYFIIGDGTNLLVKDSGIRGVVISLTKGFNTIQMDVGKEHAMIKAMAGCRMKTLCKKAIEHGVSGINFAIGIPGTVGGAISMNAGTSLGAIDKVIASVKILGYTGELVDVPREKIDYTYRALRWKKEISAVYGDFPVILEGTFSLSFGDPIQLKTEADEIWASRRNKQPMNKLSAGCFFKNPAGKSAGELIEKAGLKGKSIGGARVSEVHANFIINEGNASAADIIALMGFIREEVAKQFNVNLEQEVKIVE